ncbi:MAG: hypothetical protein QOD25_1961 [Alphaproteobacteria bacterium]|nr:hypothetical protein [Alphaproteobacteria bacterium]
MHELNPRLGGVSFFRPDPARAYHETDSIAPRRRDRLSAALDRSPADMASRRDNTRARTASGYNCLDIKAAAAS